MAKAAQKAGQDFKAAVRAGSDTASDIFTGDDYDPVTPIDETAVPPAEPRLTPNQPQVRNAPPEGARPIAPPPAARSGGGRGSGGGGVMLKNRRLMAPQGVATPDYDFKLMQKGGSVSRAGSDPQRSRREKGEANEEFDAEDEAKKYKQSLPYRGAGERNAKGDTWPHWMFEYQNQRALKGQVDANEARSSRENAQGGYYGQPPKFKSGGSVSFAKGGSANFGKDYRKGK